MEKAIPSLRTMLMALLLIATGCQVQAATLDDIVRKENLVQGNPAMVTWIVKNHINQKDKETFFLSVWGRHNKNGELLWGVIAQEAVDGDVPYREAAKARWIIKPDYPELVFMPAPAGVFLGRIYVKPAKAEFFSVIYQEYRGQRIHPSEFTQVHAINDMGSTQKHPVRQRLRQTDNAEATDPALVGNMLAAFGKPDANGNSTLTLFEAHNGVWLTLTDMDAGTPPRLLKGLLAVAYANGIGLIETNFIREGFNTPGKAKLLSERYQAVGLHHDFIHALSPEGKKLILQPWGEPLDSSIGDITALPEPIAGSLPRDSFKPYFFFTPYFVDFRLPDGRTARRLLVYNKGKPARFSLFPGKASAGSGKTEFGNMVFLGSDSDKDFFAAQAKDGSWEAFALGGDGIPDQVQWAGSSSHKGTIATKGAPSTMFAALQENNSMLESDMRAAHAELKQKNAMREAEKRAAEAALRQNKPAFIQHVMQTVRQDQFGYYQPKSDFELAERYARELGGNHWGAWLMRFDRLSTMDEGAIVRLRSTVNDPNVQAGLDRELANRNQQRTNQRVSAEFQEREAARSRERQQGAQRAAELFKSSGGAPSLSTLEQDNEARKSGSKPYEVINKKSN